MPAHPNWTTCELRRWLEATGFHPSARDAPPDDVGRCGAREAHLPRRAPLLKQDSRCRRRGYYRRRPKKRSAKRRPKRSCDSSSVAAKKLSPTPLHYPLVRVIIAGFATAHTSTQRTAHTHGTYIGPRENGKSESNNRPIDRLTSHDSRLLYTSLLRLGF
jgi:hypothetical protein